MSLFFSCQPNVPSGGNSDKTYTVNHNFARVESGYDVEKEELSGPVDSETKAAAKQKDGFELDKTKHTDGKIAQATIKADGSTVVDIYYARKEVTLTFKLNGGKFGESTDDKTMKGKFGETKVEGKELKDYITKPEKDGMQFAGWNTDKVETPASFPSKDTEYTAQWETPKAGSYKVIHWKQPIVGVTYTEKEEESLNGTVGDYTKAEVKTTYTGFHLSKSQHPDGTIKQQKIEADGKTVIDIYYDRNIVTVTFKDSDKVLSSQSGRYEAKVLEPVTPEKEGHTFKQWNPAMPKTFPLENTECQAEWFAEVLPKYKVEHWLQAIDTNNGKVYDASKHEEPNYIRHDTEPKSGKKDTQTAAKAKEYEGFETPTVTQEIIKADGSTVVKIYYVRKEVTLTFDPNGGKIGASTGVKEVKVRFGETIQETDVSTPEKDDAVFDDWNPQVYPGTTKVLGTDATTYTAQWKTVKELEITTQPNKITYNKGEQLDLAGLEFNVKYAEGGFKLLKPEWITGKYGKYTVSGFNPTTTGEQTVTVTYKKATLTFKVTVQEQTFAIGDIIDSTDSKVYKPAASFTISKSWDKYYVIIKVEGTKYTGVRYLDNNWGAPTLGYTAGATYRDANMQAPDKYLTQENIKNIVDNAAKIKSSMDKIKTINNLTAYTNENCLSSSDGSSFLNGNGGQPSGSSFIPFAARDFTISE